MASRFPLRISSRISNEHLLCHAPPSFLAPVLASSRVPFSTSSSNCAIISKVKRYNHRDAYALRQAKQRRDANLSRQGILREQRIEELGDPIRGIPTPFVESFDVEVPREVQLDAKEVDLEVPQINPDEPPPSPAHASEEKYLDHGISHEELEKSLDFSRSLIEPSFLAGEPGQEDRQRRSWEERNAIATEAVQRIISLANGSSKHRTKKNIERIVETFGRHNTDRTMKPKAPAAVKSNTSTKILEPTPRVGPDTGSSEVQIGILTAKIRVLADRYEGENRNDKINKRNLRLLLHRRQKLLSYMERKERGSERWHHMLQTLGLTPACWKGQIAVQ